MATDIFLNQLIQFCSNNATHLHQFTRYTVLSHNIEIVMWLYSDVTSSYVASMKAGRPPMASERHAVGTGTRAPVGYPRQPYSFLLYFRPIYRSMHVFINDLPTACLSVSTSLITNNFCYTRHYRPGTRTRKISAYVHANFVPLKLELSVLIIVCICSAA